MATVELPTLYVDTISLFAETHRPLLLNRAPGPGEEDVPVDSALELEVVDVGVDGIARATTRVWVDGVLAFAGGDSVEVQPAFAGPLAEVTQTVGTLRLVLHPAVPLASQETISVRVVSATAGGEHLLDETYTFTVEDRTAPRLVGVQSLAPKSVRLAFDEDVRVPSSARFTLTPRGAPAVPVAALGASADGPLVHLVLDTELTPDVVYEVRVEGVTDAHGNPVLAPYHRATFKGFRPARPPSRSFQLWHMLPGHNRRDDVTGDLHRFIACLQEVTDLLLADLDAFPDVFDLERAPEAFLDAILQDLGNPFAFELDVLARRRLASVLVEMYQQKGTALGLRNAIRFFLGIEVRAISPFASDTLVLGESELGVDWVLGPSERFARYAFNVEVERLLSPAERQRLRTLVEYLKPAHTHFVDLVEPLPPILPEHWELGLSELGETTTLH
ncbi:phage tail protein [Myxococcus llanfairpwllgwyngyllgogerychwyrndrobwllllantysiliogogogochensis]|uniref:Phage tail protein n=1 Tax=Myxococcus llanfairpwllgwyngyllgogerychwyrndrobwllllantysiliogogogochensis TaxID=2590453 RepID=A0A540WTD0_9BACT|nr:Ig-like domain-containing protein [Myxococcus llanfairpwllgwyngyllgogerychwyrndrobwllllantysiliogogogochensis]TQF11694.1 phage tail protein [Myxococcus llanfairpwllgwyngyllgogerychwyrndrobwllllantysiliogogogochensis]